MRVFPVSWSILLLLLFLASSVRAEEYSDSGNWGPDAPIEPEAAETPKEAVKEKEEEEKKSTPSVEEVNPAPSSPPAAKPSNPGAKPVRPVEGINSPVEDGQEVESTKEKQNSNTAPEPDYGDTDEDESPTPADPDPLPPIPSDNPVETDELGYHDPDPPLEKIEWFSLRAHYGSHGYGAMMSFFTLRWRHVYWSIIKTGFSLDGTGWYRADAGDWFVAAGTHVGYQHAFDSRDTSQLRVGIGLLGGIGMSPAMDLKSGESYAAAVSIGPYLDFEMSYVIKLWKHVAFEAGFEMIFPLYGYYDFLGESVSGEEYSNITSQSQYNYPIFMNFIGLRF